MRRGDLDGFKASKIHEPTTTLTDEQAREVDQIISTRLTGKDPAGLRRSTTLAVTKIDPDGYAQRCHARRAHRKVELIPTGEGMVKVCGDLPAEDGTAAYTRITREARRRRQHDKTKTLDQHRCQVYSDLLLTDNHGIRTAPRAEVFVYLDFLTWLGLNNDPANLAGHGTIPAWLARKIAYGDNSTVRRVLTDPDTGQIVSVGRHAYRPPTDLARLIHIRDRECRMPGCHRPAQACDIDHGEQWYADHGETADENLIALCRRHHRLKDSPGWTFHLDKTTGRLTVTTPTGDEYSTDPEPLHEPRTAQAETRESTVDDSTSGNPASGKSATEDAAGEDAAIEDAARDDAARDDAATGKTEPGDRDVPPQRSDYPDPDDPPPF